MSELNLGLLNALKYHWCETSIISNCLICVVSKDFIFKKSVQGNGMRSQATTTDWAISTKVHVWANLHILCNTCNQ